MQNLWCALKSTSYEGVVEELAVALAAAQVTIQMALERLEAEFPSLWVSGNELVSLPTKLQSMKGCLVNYEWMNLYLGSPSSARSQTCSRSF